VKGVEAYKVYETAGGGTAGVNKAVIDIFGKQAANSAQAVAAAQQRAASAQAVSAGAWYTKTPVLVGGGILVALGIYAATR
jgi:arginase family enzyme